MEFNNLHSNYGWIILCQAAVILTIALLFGGLVFFLLRKLPIRYEELRFLLAFVAVVGVTVVGSFIGSEWEQQSRNDFRANIQQKYDVDEVLTEYQDQVVSIRVEESQNLYVIVDGKTYLFNLKQDKTTWEPTLSDPPINGGMDVTKTLGAEDLLK